MGIDNALILNHNMHYNNGNELMEKLRARTGLTVANGIMDNHGNYLQGLGSWHTKQSYFSASVRLCLI